jgi:carbon storage regulator
MLVLTRVGEEIIIGGEIRVIVTAVRGDRVRIGIDAPPSVRVDRQEIHQRMTGFSNRLGNNARPRIRGPQTEQAVELELETAG